jgi:hypothetical protein
VKRFALFLFYKFQNFCKQFDSLFRVYSAPCHDMARPQVADEGDYFEMWRAAVNMTRDGVTIDGFFPFRRLLRLAVLQWKYLTPPPHGV